MAAFSIVETKPEVTVLIILTRVCSQYFTSVRLLRDPQGDCPTKHPSWDNQAQTSLFSSLKLFFLPAEAESSEFQQGDKNSYCSAGSALETLCELEGQNLQVHEPLQRAGPGPPAEASVSPTCPSHPVSLSQLGGKTE